VTNNLLACLIDANLAAALAILGVLAIRRRARTLIGARSAYALWLIVPAAMLAALAPPRTVTAPAPAPMASASISAAPASASAPVQRTAIPARPAPDMSQVLLGLWLAGVGVSLAMLVVGQRRTLRQFGSITVDAGDPRFARAASPGVGPAIVGVIRPRLIVPADFETRFEPGERALILAHERFHLASGHAAINAVVALVEAVNWFNPLIHLAARCARLDQELACDAAVVSRFSGERHTYARALLKTQLAGAAPPLGCAWPSRSATVVTQRIELLALATPGRGRGLAGAAVVTVLTVGAGLVAWAAQPPVTAFAPAADQVPAKASTAIPPAPQRLAEAAPVAAAFVSAPTAGADVAATRLAPIALPQTSPAAASPARIAAVTPPAAVARLAAPGQAVAPVMQAELAPAFEPVTTEPTPVRDIETAAPIAPRCDGLVGTWRGFAFGPSFQGVIILHVSAYANGALSATLVMPTLGSEDYGATPLQGFRRDGQQIEFRYRRVPLNPEFANWSYDGTLSADGSTIRGVFSQLGVRVPTDFGCIGGKTD
jgi:beta-lactamase regulating signal transducer with metallopeptidase domain